MLIKSWPRTKALAVSAAAWLTFTANSALLAQSRPESDETKLTAITFDRLAKQIRPQPGESRWLEIPWLIDVHEARRQAAAEGKPLFIYSGGGATGIGAC